MKAVVIGLGLALLAVFGYVGYVWVNGPIGTKPTSTPAVSGRTPTLGTPTRSVLTPTRGATTGRTSASAATTTPSGTISGPGWRATLPDGWESSGGPELTLWSPDYDSIFMVVAPATGNPDDTCTLFAGGSVTKLPDVAWGGRTAVAYEEGTGDDYYAYRCVEYAGTSYSLVLMPADASTRSSSTKALESLLSSWVWL